ncbi:hypothetical protein [Devosia sp. DBB001]|nr:hypothetical protein [Devosia sp. DBB001]
MASVDDVTRHWPSHCTQADKPNLHPALSLGSETGMAHAPAGACALLA